MRIATLPLLIAVLFTAGCAGSLFTAKKKPAAETPPVAQDDTPPPSEPAITVRPSDPVPVVFGDELPMPVRPVDRHQARIGLYGELVSYTPNEAGRTDGASNIRQVTVATEGACFDPTIDPSGKWLAFASTMHTPSADIYIRTINSRTHTQLTADPADDVMPAFSPEGSRIAFASNRSGNWDLYVMPVEGGAPLQITSDTDHELHPSWSPDGRQLVYCRLGSQSGRWELWIVDVDNPGVKRFLEYGRTPEWGPDIARSTILFQRARQRGSRFHSVWTLDIIDDNATNITEIVSAANAALINPSWSPDGSRVVFSTVVEPQGDPNDRPTLADVWVVNLDGTGRTILTNGHSANFQPVWSRDGGVYFVSNRSGVDNIWAVAPVSQLSSKPGIATAIPDRNQ